MEEHNSTPPELGDLLTRAARADAALRQRFADAGLEPGEITDRAALAALPVRSKDDLIGAAVDPVQEARNTGQVRVPARIFQSPGPIYEAQPPGDDPWRWAPVLEAIGLEPGDRVINCFGYHLSPAGAMFDAGIIAAGGTVVPAGIGNQTAQLQAITDLRIRGYVGLPSYLKALIEIHRSAGGTAETFGIDFALVTAEPLPDSLRAELSAWVPRICMAYGTAEVGLIGYEDDAGPGLLVDDRVIVDVCEIGTGVPVTEGEGEVVVTVLRDEAPVVRFGTGDLSAWAEHPHRLAGVLGRVGQATKVRGMFVHPRQVTAVLDAEERVTAGRFVITRSDDRDHLRCEVVIAADAELDDDDVADMTDRLGESIRSSIRVRAEVVVVGSVPVDSGVLVDAREW